MNYEPITRSFFQVCAESKTYIAVAPLEAMRGLDRRYGGQSLLVERPVSTTSTAGAERAEPNRATILALPMLRLQTRNLELVVTGMPAARDVFVRRLKVARLVSVSGHGRLLLRSASAIWDVLREAQAFFDVDGSAEDFTFGLAGYLGYDVSRLIENIPMRPRAGRRPDLDLAIHAIRVEIEDERMSVVVNRIRGLDMPCPDEVLAAMVDRPDVHSPPDGDARVRFSMSQVDFEAIVRKAKRLIGEGEIYQVQLGHTIEVVSEADPYAVHERLRAGGSAPYTYYLAGDALSVFGASPESLVTVVDGRARMEPIAGTAPRGATPEEDRDRRIGLVSSRKERAEHLMLVDLCRNDLGRCAEPGSVEVPVHMSVRPYGNVIHLVSDVTATMTPTTSPWDVIRATFPAGTMTGAPKVRAMEIIDDLETSPRHVYSGAVVRVDVGGYLDSVLCIRSVQHTPGVFALRSSAGVVADSDPAAEWAETLHKMATPFTAVTGEELLR